MTPPLSAGLRRLLRWAAVRWTIRIGAVLLALALLPQVLLTWSTADRESVDATAPTLEELDAAISGAEDYVDRLYQEIPGGQAVVSEYVGLPLRVTFPESGHVVLPSDPAVLIASGEQGPDRESYRFTYAEAGTTLTLQAVLLARPGGAVRLEVSQLEGDPLPMNVGLGDLAVATWGRDTTDRAAVVALGPEQLGELRSLRYTIRHVAMVATSFYRYRGDDERADRLARLTMQAGYDPTNDVYAPLWGMSAGREDDYFYDVSVYPDCAPGTIEAMPHGERYYPYESKVCSLPTWGYIALTREDPLVRTLQAVHVVQEHGDADATFSDGEHPSLTPESTVAQLEKRFRDGVGIGTCLPGSCTTDVGSTLRTAVFGVLETTMGFERGDEVSRGYADAVARDLLRVQADPSGLVHSLRLGDITRPAQAGGFYTTYDAEFRSGTPENLSRRQVDLVMSELDIRREYHGELATNAETTLVTHAFLVRYRCARYRVGCAGLP